MSFSWPVVAFAALSCAEGSPLCRVTSDGSGEAPIVQTSEGLARGCTSEDGGSTFTLPFAEPPVGDLRFRAPRAKEAWDGIYDGTKAAGLCPQFGLGEVYIGEEDCLYLTVHTPLPGNTSGPLPVLFWIYGGIFMLGDTYEFGNTNIMCLVHVFIFDALFFFLSCCCFFKEKKK